MIDVIYLFRFRILRWVDRQRKASEPKKTTRLSWDTVKAYVIHNEDVNAEWRVWNMYNVIRLLI